MKKVIFSGLFLVFFLFFGIDVLFADEGGHAGKFWTSEMQILAGGMALALVLMIVLPIKVHVVDEQLGYFFLVMGGALLALSMHLGVVDFSAGDFVQKFMHGHREPLVMVLGEPKFLLACYFLLSLLAIVFQTKIVNLVKAWSEKQSSAAMVGIFTLVVGSLGSISVVVMAVLGAIFFGTLQKVTRKDFTPSVVCFSAAIGISALLSTIGEPLSLFIARNLGEGTPYLIRTYAGIVAVNMVLISFFSYWLALRAKDLEETTEEAMIREAREAEALLGKMSPSGHLVEVHENGSSDEILSVAGKTVEKEVAEVVEAVEQFEAEQHNFAHELDALLHSTSKLFFFVIGLLLFGEAVKPIASHIFGDMSPNVAFFLNSVSAVADNALLGLLEVQKGMSQDVVFVLGLSLAFWGVGLVPGNVCNVVLKEKLSIPFGTWAKYGMPLAVILAIINFIFVLLGAGHWLTF